MHCLGSGKTTQVPQFIMEDCAERGQQCRILLSQPRRIAACSVAKRISQERNDAHGNSVGHQMRMDSCISSTTNLILTTRYFLLKGSFGREKKSYTFNSIRFHCIFIVF